MIEHTKNKTNSAFLVAVQTPETTRTAVENHLAELKELTGTLDIKTVGSMIVGIEKPTADLYIGKGKAAEITEEVARVEAENIIFDEELSPSQQRNWERLASVPVLDRREVILDIFARHAHTREAMLQIELARLEYTLPRLKRAWTHLSRQQGGSRGTRGEGEKQIELDRRSILQRIHIIKQNIGKIKNHRNTQRKKRYVGSFPSFSIVGYTNAGKSSLLNLLTGAGVKTENKLFATLDPTTRKSPDFNGTSCLFTDTVGFIRKLPTDLVEAFHSTLEESTFSDFLIHVIDVSNPEFTEHMKTTSSVLYKLGTGDKPVITVFNKIDRVEHPENLIFLHNRYNDSVFISLKTGEGLKALFRKIEQTIRLHLTKQIYSFPFNRHDLVAFVYRNGKVLYKNYRENSIMIKAEVSEYARNRLSEYAIQQ